LLRLPTVTKRAMMSQYGLCLALLHEASSFARTLPWRCQHSFSSPEFLALEHSNHKPLNTMQAAHNAQVSAQQAQQAANQAQQSARSAQQAAQAPAMHAAVSPTGSAAFNTYHAAPTGTIPLVSPYGGACVPTQGTHQVANQAHGGTALLVPGNPYGPAPVPAVPAAVTK
jgi:hypothetical protein